MDLPLISVLIPAYNHERHVGDTINSIIAQTYKNLELIVIDDGSKDNTFRILEAYKKKCKQRFSRVWFETQPNQGTTVTLNKLIEKARGDYIYMIASDDEAKPNAIEYLYNALIQDKKNVVAFCDNEIINEFSERIAWNETRCSVPLEEGYQTFWQYLVAQSIHIPSNPNKYGSYASLVQGNYIPNGFLIKKEAILKAGGYKKKAPLEDWYMHLQLSKLGKYVFVPEVLLSYRWHDNNTIKQQNKMNAYCIQTLKYEREILYKSQNKELIDIFDQYHTNKKVVFKIGTSIILEKVKSIDERYFYIKLGNFSFKIKR